MSLQGVWLPVILQTSLPLNFSPSWSTSLLLFQQIQHKKLFTAAQRTLNLIEPVHQWTYWVSEYLHSTLLFLNMHWVKQILLRLESKILRGLHQRFSSMSHCPLLQEVQNFTFLQFQHYVNTNRKLSAFYTCHEKERWSEKFPCLKEILNGLWNALLVFWLSEGSSSANPTSVHG